MTRGLNLLAAIVAAAGFLAATPSRANPEVWFVDPFGRTLQMTYSVPGCKPSSFNFFEVRSRGQGFPNSGGTIQVTGQSGGGRLDWSPNGDMTFTPSPGGGKGMFSMAAGGAGLLILEPRQDACAPILAPDTATTDHRRPVTVNVLANDEAASSGLPLRVMGVSKPSRGTVSWNPGGTLSYLPEPGYAGAVAMTYTAGDGAGLTGTSTFTVTTQVCHGQVYRDASLDCSGRHEAGSSDFAGQCLYVPPGWETVEVPCP